MTFTSSLILTGSSVRPLCRQVRDLTAAGPMRTEDEGSLGRGVDLSVTYFFAGRLGNW